LDKLSEYAIKNIESLSFRMLALLTSYCVNLEYLNTELINCLESEILKRMKNSFKINNKNKFKVEDFVLTSGTSIFDHKNGEKDRNQLKNNTEQLIENINVEDLNQIIVSICKLKIEKPDLLELIELQFINNLNHASADNLTSFTTSHSIICENMVQKYQENSDEVQALK